MRTRSFLFRLLALGALLVLVTRAADDTPKNYDLPGGDAVTSLKQFSETSGRETLFAAETVRGIRTAAVKGEFTPKDALDQMLAGTGLVSVADEKTGALAIKKAPLPNDPRVAQTAATPKDQSKAEDAKLVLETVQVTGTRIRGLLAGATAQPVLTLDSEDIDRTGAQSIGDLLRYIPQVSAFTTGQANTQATITRNINVQTGATTLGATATQIDATAGRVTATIRGAPAGATLMLVDGKRAPKNNQSRSGDGYDLSGIPLAAVERIEVLLDGASSIYGADAMGGAINVILKKSYRGSEVRLGYDNTFDTDSGVMTGSLTHGFGSGKLRGIVTASFEQANSLALRDRDFVASYDRRPYGGTDYRDSTLPGGAGRVSRSGTVPLPGLTTTSAAIPPGTTGTNLTVSDYATAGPIADPFDLGQYVEYASSYERYAALARFDYAFRDWLELTGEMRIGRNRNSSLPPPIQARNLAIPTGYPGNPFGIPILLNKYFLDLQPERVATDDTRFFSFGASGRLPHRWRYDASINFSDSHIQSDGDSGTSIVAAQLTAAIAAGQSPNLFYDSSRVANPNASGVIEALTAPVRDEEKAETWTYLFQADGPVYTLPAGDVAAATGFELREEYADFPLRSPTDTQSAQSGSDKITAYFVEVNVPVFGQDFRRPLLRQLNVSGSYRYEEYQSGGSAKNPRAGVAWRPVQWLLMRGSYGEGFKVPTLAQRNAPITITNSFLTATPANLDPLRGNTVNSPVYPVTRGGKADLMPERSENTTAGFVAEVPFIKGLSLSFDWFDNVFNDRVSTLVFSQMAALYPSRITRGPNLPTDPAGWAGPVTAADMRAINVSFSQTTGFDISLKYDRKVPWGDVVVDLTGTKYTRNVLVPTPGGDPSPTVNTDSLPVQVNGNAFLYRKGWGAGVMAIYRAAGRSATDRIATPSAIRWDLQFNYDFGKAPWLKGRESSWYAKALADSQLSLTVFNILDTQPPFDYSYFPDNTVLDTRMRRFAISVRKQF